MTAAQLGKLGIVCPKGEPMRSGLGWRRPWPRATILLVFSLIVALALCRVLPAVGQEIDHAAVFELGGAVARDTREPSPWQGGGTVAVEFTPIERWLEIEIGASALRGHSGTELSADFLLKKPYRLSARAEFMIGLGPEVVRTAGDGGSHLGVEGVLDFMFWPRKNIGWYVEPGYEVVLGPTTTSHSVNMTGGLLFGWH